MKKKDSHDTGRFSVDFEIANNDDLGAVGRGHLDAARVRRKVIRGEVSTGITRLVLPVAVVNELGLPMRSKTKVRYSDGREIVRPMADSVRVYLQGRDGLFNAVVEPERDTAVIGALVLNTLDFLVDSDRQCLVPRDPNHITCDTGIEDDD